MSRSWTCRTPRDFRSRPSATRTPSTSASWSSASATRAETGATPTSVEGVVTAPGPDDHGHRCPRAATPQTLSNLIATDADIRSGRSGGPLLDASGAGVGVDVAASASDPHGTSATNGCAIPIDDAEAVARPIIAGQESSGVQAGGTPFLGVQLGSATQYGSGATGSGVAVSGVVAGSAAGPRAWSPVPRSPQSTARRSAPPRSSRRDRRCPWDDRLGITSVDASGSAHSASVTLHRTP